MQRRDFDASRTRTLGEILCAKGPRLPVPAGPGDDEPPTANALLTQPEALLIFERLASDRDRLREGWPVDSLDFELLENMALISGVEL